MTSEARNREAFNSKSVHRPHGLLSSLFVQPMHSPFVLFRRAFALLLLGAMLVFPQAVALAADPAFSDVPEGHAVFDAVQYLKEKQIITGFDDPNGDPSGRTYRPDQPINRAEAVKLIVIPLLDAQQLGQFGKTTPYGDIEDGVWYLPYVEAARLSFKIIDGPPKKPNFFGEDPVRKAEFIKMMLIANKVDVSAFSEVSIPLSRDAADPAAWYYPYMRYAISSSVTVASKDGTLSPARELTRGDVALFLYRFMLYREGNRTQDLLSSAETEIQNIQRALDRSDIAEADYASVRALLAARGAHASEPDSNITKAAVKMTESYRAIIRAYRAVISGDQENVIKLASDAWRLADQAKQFSPALKASAEQIQKTAKSMADGARAAQ